MDEGVLGREYADGDVICRQGEPGDRMYVIQAGRATVLREDGGVQVVVGELKNGDIFGEMAIFDRQPRSATVRAAGMVRVLTLDKRAFMRQVHEDPPWPTGSRGDVAAHPADGRGAEVSAAPDQRRVVVREARTRSHLG
jgi:CRP-like cAMP-binding protein